jgi:integrase
MLARTGGEAEFPFPVHPHMLRHAWGSKLANDRQDTRAVQHYLGRKNIQHTVRYTELSRSLDNEGCRYDHNSRVGPMRDFGSSDAVKAVLRHMNKTPGHRGVAFC